MSSKIELDSSIIRHRLPMSSVKFNLRDKYFNMVCNGTKTVEIRFGIRNIATNDTITFVSGGVSVSAIVTNVKIYDGFAAALTEHLNEALPGFNFIEALREYERIYEEKIKEATANNESIMVTAITFRLTTR